jgi:hypothetical protein
MHCLSPCPGEVGWIVATWPTISLYFITPDPPRGKDRSANFLGHPTNGQKIVGSDSPVMIQSSTLLFEETSRRQK